MSHNDGLDRFLAWRQVRDLTGLGRTTAWRLRRAGQFPEPVPISPGRVAWRARDIAAWHESRGPIIPSFTPKPAPLTAPARGRPSLRLVTASPSRDEDLKAPVGEVRKTGARRRSIVSEGQLGFDF